MSIPSGEEQNGLGVQDEVENLADVADVGNDGIWGTGVYDNKKDVGDLTEAKLHELYLKCCEKFR